MQISIKKNYEDNISNLYPIFPLLMFIYLADMKIMRNDVFL